nr:inactive tyrosine-protein kinase 7-like [Ciona intestinalis]|eukprot:XP_018669704.1 inactive tyrosine-protein kinase 7-like [Ciona intestinalis]
MRKKEITALCFLLVFILSGCNTFQFKPRPRSQDATNDRNAVLRCGILGPEASNYRISWIMNAAAIINNERRYQNGNNLYFRPINKEEDSGKFQCVATNKNNSLHEEISDPAQFNIKWIEAGSVELRVPQLKTEILNNTKVMLKCNIDGNPKPANYTWSVNGTVLGNKLTGVEIRNRRLIITSAVLRANDGLYTCCALSHPQGKRCTPKGQGFPLRVIDRRIPVLIKGPESQTVKKNSDVTFSCNWEADPSPVITWYYDDVRSSRPLANRTRSQSSECRKRCIFSNGTMLLRNVREKQVGTYYCKAGNSDDSVASATLKLAAIQQFGRQTIEKYFTEGENFEFTCQPPEASPTAELEWYHNGRKIGAGPGHVFRTANILVIDEPRASDEGTYTCMASNMAGSVNMTLVLTLAVDPSIAPLPDKNVNEGYNLSWNCPAHGVPDLNIAWYKDGIPIAESPPKVMIQGPALLIHDVQLSDHGRYSCSASNTVGSSQTAHSNTALLTVNERFKFVNKLSDTCITTGVKQQFKCGVTGSVATRIQWTKLNGTKPTHVSSAPGYSTLVLGSPSEADTGTYVCTASDTSSGNSLTQEMRVTVVQPPEILHPPNNLTLFEGEKAVFDCGVGPGLAKMFDMEWRFHHLTMSRHDIPTRGNPIRVFPNGSLVIPRARMDDSGLYTCEYRICDFWVRRQAELTVVKEGPGTIEDPTVPEDKTNATQMIQTIALSVSGGVAYILVTVALIIYCRGRHKSSGKNSSHVEEEMKMLNGSTCNGDGRMRSNHDDELVANGVSMNELSRLSDDVVYLQYPAENVEPLTVIGKGKFGEIFLSKAPGIFPDLEEDILVMVKSFDTVSNSSVVPKLRAEFNREINTLHRANHDHVVKLLAISSSGNPHIPELLITEYLEWGILKLCLQASKEGKIPKFTKTHKMNMCCQLASGLDHLHKLGLLHNDVATRNIVVSSHLLIKISMLGLSSEGFENEYVELDAKTVPLRWSSPEALLDGTATPKTDVFMFGVTCWEIFTLGEFPHSDLSNDALLKAIRSNQTPTLPALESTKRITSLINKCCHASPSNRPEMKQISKKLQSITGGEVKQNGANGIIKTNAIVTADEDDVINNDEFSADER